MKEGEGHLVKLGPTAERQIVECWDRGKLVSVRLIQVEQQDGELILSVYKPHSMEDLVRQRSPLIFSLNGVVWKGN